MRWMIFSFAIGLMLVVLGTLALFAWTFADAVSRRFRGRPLTRYAGTSPAFTDRPQRCLVSGCGHLNRSGAKFCTRCGHQLFA